MVKTNKTSELQKVEANNIANINWKGMYESTPKEYIQIKTGRGNIQLSYVETGYIIKRLNELFNYLWDFKLISEKVEHGQVVVKGELIVYLSPELKLSKSQYGGATVKISKTNATPVSIADDMKAAASDALKKCASLFGIASDIYWGGEVEEEHKVGEVAPVTNVETKTTTVEESKPLAYIDTSAGSMLSKTYFLKMSQLGITGEEAKDKVKKAFKLESYRDVTKEQLQNVMQSVDKKVKEKDEEFINSLDGGVEGI